MAGVGSSAIAALGAGSQTLYAHQPGDPLAPGPLAALAQFHLHPRTAVTAVVLGVYRGDRNRQGSILTSSSRYRPPAPGIETSPRYHQYPTHQRHRETGPLRRDKGESHALSLAKKAVAFFRISRSIRRR